MIFRSVSTCFIPAAAIGTTHGASQNGTFRDRNASLDEVNTGEDVRKICTAATAAKDAAGRAWTLKAAIRNGDALPRPMLTRPSSSVSPGAACPMATTSPPSSASAARTSMRAGLGRRQAIVNNVKAGSTLDLALPTRPWRLAVACGLHSPL